MTSDNKSVALVFDCQGDNTVGIEVHNYIPPENQIGDVIDKVWATRRFNPEHQAEDWLSKLQSLAKQMFPSLDFSELLNKALTAFRTKKPLVLVAIGEGLLISLLE